MFIWLIMALLSDGTAQREGVRVITLPRDQVACISKHISQYLEGNDPVVFIPSGCPNTAVSARDLNQHATGQDFTRIPVNPGSTVLILSKTQLNCLHLFYLRMEKAQRIPAKITWKTDQCPPK
jgi:hypothetical protein